MADAPKSHLKPRKHAVSETSNGSGSFIIPKFSAEKKTPGRKPGTTVVRWNHDEWGTFIDELRRIRKTKPSRRIDDDIAIAMLLLPEDRRRPISSAMRTSATEHLRALDEMERAEAAAAAAAAAAQPVVEPTPAPPAVQAAPRVVFDDDDDEDPAEAMVHDLAITIATIFARALAQPIVKEAFSSILRNAVSPSDEADPLEARWPEKPEPNTLDRTRPVRVLVGGIIDPQGRRIKALFGKQFDVKCWSTDMSIDVLKTLSSSADITIARVDFVGHKHTQIMKERAKARGKTYVPCNGGMTALIAMMGDLQRQNSQVTH